MPPILHPSSGNSTAMSPPSSAERWARFLEEHAPGLTWLAATLLEWSELPPGARRAWTVTIQAARSGEVSSLVAMQEETGVLAVAAMPDAPPPLFGEPSRVRRALGAPETLEALVAQVPELLLRRGPGVRRSVFVYDGEPRRRYPSVRRAAVTAVDALERFRARAGGEWMSMTAGDLLGPVNQGHVFELVRENETAGMFRVEAIAARRVQVADVCIDPDLRGRGLGRALLESAAAVARSEYARGCVVAVPAEEVAERTARGAGFVAAGTIEDLEFA